MRLSENESNARRNPMWHITKEFRFEGAHRLVQGYQGGCAHIHGHSWIVRITLGGSQLDQYSMVTDFKNLKPIKDWIDENLDHAMMVSVEDQAMLEFLEQNNQRNFVAHQNPTSEWLAKYLYRHCKNEGYPVKMVEVDETCTSSCRYWE